MIPRTLRRGLVSPFNRFRFFGFKIGIQGESCQTLEIIDGGLKTPQRIAISVDRMAAAVPAPETGDPNPLTEDEIALVTGPKLKIAERTILQKPRQTGSARITMRMINAAETNPSRFVGDLWWGAAAGETAGSTGAIRAAGIVRMCRLMDAAGIARLPVRASPRHHAGPDIPGLESPRRR